MIECYVDGSYRPQGSAAAIVIYSYKKEIFRAVKPVAAQSSMAAECEAVLFALMICYARNFPQPTIYTDSKNLHDHYKGLVKVKNKNMSYYVYAIKELERVFPFTLSRVSRNDVYIPDEMCKNFILDAHHYFESSRKK